jgi:hypothetical protein
MSTTPDTAAVSLPEDLASCHELLRSLAQSLGEREQRIAQLEAAMDALIRQRYPITGWRSIRSLDWKSIVARDW